MLARLVPIGLLIVVLLVGAGCAPIPYSFPQGQSGGAPVAESAPVGDTRGASEPTNTPTPTVAPTQTPTATPTTFVSPLPTPEEGELVVTKTANTSLSRTYDWNIQKTASKDSLRLGIGQSFVVDYSVVLDLDGEPVDDDWTVAGVISVNNPGPAAITVNGVADNVSPSIVPIIDCGVSFPHSLPAGSTLDCAYSASLPDDTGRTNTATAIMQNLASSGTTDFPGTVAVDFAEATVNSVDECVNVTDSVAGALGTICAGFDTLPQTFTYSSTIGPFDKCGAYTVVNSATFKAIDTGATNSDEHALAVTVPCGGCTLTQGYWRTHSNEGPASYNDTWALIEPNGEDTPFFQSGQTYYQVMWSSPEGNAYYILAPQYIAAKLNQLRGAQSTPEVDAAMAWAKSFFEANAPAPAPSNPLRAEVIAAATTLDKYNNGELGPGHCAE